MSEEIQKKGKWSRGDILSLLNILWLPFSLFLSNLPKINSFLYKATNVMNLPLSKLKILILLIIGFVLSSFFLLKIIFKIKKDKRLVIEKRIEENKYLFEPVVPKKLLDKD